jgi:AcrR family transcriptional regulator
MAILSQAARLFNSKGSRATTLKDIAESLGLTKTSLYYYVRTKEELIYQCYMAALDHHHRNLDLVESRHEGALERASAFFLLHFQDWVATQEGRAPCIAALLEIAALKEPHRQEVEQRYIAMFQRLRSYIRAGVADKTIRPCEPTAVTRAMLGSVDWAFSWLQSLPREEVLDAGRKAWRILAQGIYAGGGDYVPAEWSHETERGMDLQGFNRQERNRLKQEAFFKAGTWFFNKQGFNGTSLDEIAEHLNVSKGAFYYHIKNKEDLLIHCYNRSLDIREQIHDKTSQMQCTGFQKAELTCRQTFYFQNSSEGPLIRYTSITALPIDKRKPILKRTEQGNQMFGQFLQEGIEDGSVKPVDTFIAQNLITGAVNAAMDLKLWRKVDDIDAAALDYFDVFFNGLEPRGKTA